MGDLPTSSALIQTVRQEGDCVIVTVKGEIDLQASPELRVALLELLKKYSPKKLVLNLSRVAYMDSSAIAVLVEMLKKMNSAGGKIYLTSLQPRVQGLLEIVRLNTIFSIVATDQEAVSK